MAGLFLFDLSSPATKLAAQNPPSTATYGLDQPALTATVTLKGGAYPTLDAAKAGGAVTVNYGLFINAVIRFVIVAFAIFILVKQINRLRWQEEAKEPAAPPEPSREEVLLAEIRDLLGARLKA